MKTAVVSAVRPLGAAALCAATLGVVVLGAAALGVAVLLSSCASTRVPPPAPDAAQPLGAGQHEVTETQYAVFEESVHPGVTVFHDDFSGRRRVQDGFVLEEDGRSFLRFAGTREGSLRLRGIDSATRDLRLRAEIRFPSEQYGELTVFARQDWESQRVLELMLSSSDYRAGERAPALNAAGQLGAGFLDARRLSDWQELEVILVGTELRLSLGGETLLETTELSNTDPGRLELRYVGALDIANIHLESFDQGTPAQLGSPTGARALLITELQDDFSGAALLPWWQAAGDAAPREGALVLRANEEHFSHVGIRTRALFSGDGSIELDFERPADDAAAVILFEMPRMEDSYALFLAADMLLVVRFLDGAGKTLAQMPVQPEIWRDAGGGQEYEQVRLTVQGGEFFLRLNGQPLARAALAPDLTAGLLVGYAGYMQQGDEHRIGQVSIARGLPPAFAPEAYQQLAPRGAASAVATPAPEGGAPEGGAPEGNLPEGNLPETSPEVSLPPVADPFPPPAAPRIDSFNRPDDGSWWAGANTASTATAELQYDEADGNGVLALHFEMAAGNGLHAHALRSMELDVSQFGGIAFRARAEGVERAHISLFEEPSGPEPGASDRLNAFFSVDEQWREFRIPFAQNRFLLAAHEVALGADGVFEFARLGAVMFEIWDYVGRGSLYIDDLRLLDAEASNELNSRLVLEGFESQDRVAVALPYQQLFTGDRATAEFSVTDEGGAQGSARRAEVHGSKEQWEYIDLRLDGTVSAHGHDGVGFFIRGDGVDEYIFELRELEPHSSVMASLDESFQARVPLSQDWVEWRFPFDARSMRQPEYHPLHSGEIEGDILRSLSFLAPHEQHIAAMSVEIDELFLFGAAGAGEMRDVAVGLFLPSAAGAPDALLEHVIHSVFELNLGRVPGYRVRPGLAATNVDTAIEVAEEQDLPFFIRPVYRREGESVLLTLEVVNTTAREVTRQISSNVALGLDIFQSLDDLSVTAVNTIADTNLSFRDRVQLVAPARAVYREPLTQMPDYMRAFDGVATQPAGPTPGRDEAPGLQLSPGAEGGGLVLTDPYLEGIEQFSYGVRPGRDAALFYWNYRARDSHNSLRLKGRTLTVSINGFDTSFAVPDDLLIRRDANGSARLDPERWYRVELRMIAPDSYEVELEGRALGTAAGPDLRFGRVGMGVELHPAAFRNLRVEYRE